MSFVLRFRLSRVAFAYWSARFDLRVWYSLFSGVIFLRCRHTPEGVRFVLSAISWSDTPASLIATMALDFLGVIF